MVATPDGRDLDVYLAGPADGEVLFFHSARPVAPLAYGPMAEQMAARGSSLRRVQPARVRLLDPPAGTVHRRRRRRRPTVLDHLGAERAWIMAGQAAARMRSPAPR